MHSGVTVQPEKAGKNQLFEIIWKQNASFFHIIQMKRSIKVVDNTIIIYSDDQEKKKKMRKKVVILQN